MKKKTNTFLIHSLILLSFTVLIFPLNYSKSSSNEFFLSPQSSLKEKSENNFESIFRAVLKSSKNIPAEIKDQLLKHLKEEDTFGIKAQVSKHFPTNPKIYDNYIWSAGFSIVVGFDPKAEKIIIIPTSKISGKDSSLSAPLITDADSLTARNYISTLIEEKHEEITLKKYILKSGMDTISGFLFNVDLFEHYKILNIFTEIFLPLNPKETLYQVVDNSFKIKNTHAETFFNNIIKKIGADNMFSLLMDIITERKEADSMTKNASNIIMHLLPKINKDILLDKFNSSDENHMQYLVSLMATEEPDTFVSLAQHILIESEGQASPFIKNLFLNQFGKLKPEHVQLLAINLERYSKNEKVRTLANNLIGNLGLHPYKNLLLIVHDLGLDLSIINSPSEIYNKLITTLHDNASPIIILPVLELLNAVQPEFLPDTIIDDIAFLMENNQKLTDTLTAYSISIIAKKNTLKASDTLLKMLADDKYQENVKTTIEDNIHRMNPEYVFRSGLNLLKGDNKYSPQQKTNILKGLTNIADTINKDHWEEVRNYIEKEKLSSNELYNSLLLLTHINNKQGSEFIANNQKQIEKATEDSFAKLLSFIINNSSDPDTITEIAFTNNADKKIKTEALTRLKDLRLTKTSAVRLLNQLSQKGINPTALSATANLLKNNINDILLHIQPVLSGIIKDADSKDNFLLHASIITILDKLNPYNINQDLIDTLVYARDNIFIFDQKPYADIAESFIDQQNLIDKEKEQSIRRVSDLVTELKNTKDDNKRFNILINIEQTAQELNDKSFVPLLMKLIKDATLMDDEIFMIGRVIINSGYNHRIALADYIMPKLMEKNKLHSAFKESYPKLLQITGLSHKLLLWQKIRLDWQQFGVSTRDIIKGYLHSEDKENFIKEISALIGDDVITFSNVTWTNPTQSYINEEFLPIRKINAKQFQKIFTLLYSHLDTPANTDILLGEEYEIIGRNSVPEYYYSIYEESNDENEIITPPSNPLYQKLFSRHVPWDKSGVHRTLEQRISSMDAKLVTLFCQLYSKASVTRNLTIGTDINPKEDDLWAIRYNQHDRRTSNYALKDKFLLQTTDWKNHTSGTLMWYFMNYAEKFPLKWVKLKSLLLKKLEERDINIYQYTEDGDEVRVSTHKKYNSGEETHIPKYIYDLTTYPKNEADSLMRLLVNDAEITKAITDMIIYTSDHLVDGTISEKKLYAVDVLNEIYLAVAKGEIPANFAHYRGTIAIHNAIEDLNTYYRKKRAEADAKTVRKIINQSA